jgi:hypothetical protein
MSFTKSKITDFELRYMKMFIEEGWAVLPSRDASDWPNATKEQFQFVCDVRERLAKFHELYSTPIEFPENEVREW